jgi:hypothetical protein
MKALVSRAPISSGSPAPHSDTPQVPRQEPGVAQVPQSGVGQDDVAEARKGSPTSPIHQQPTRAPPAPPIAALTSANFTSIDDFGYEHLSPSSSTQTSSVTTPGAAEDRTDRRRSKTIDVNYLNATRDAALDQATAERPVYTGKAQLVNYSRVAGGPINGGLSRKVSKSGHTTTPDAPVTSHSRAPSEQQTSAPKFSMSDVVRSKYQNFAEVTHSNPPPPAASSAEAKEKMKGRWWQRTKDNKKGGSWMDQVVKSGSRSGVLLTDDVATDPIVRY